ncbi:hypothetical protein PanWU01x14_271880 [Parasponia andersonii]|uniref:Uncharacterized protein n=1 Tax=Parasponia andersonii TaxID=3476 RepID=A0A2P5B4M6_PARAD|nr:hypothetical protein PanWU01x14_271880 [Parasponia andersonii]
MASGGSIQGATGTTPTNSPGAFSNRSENYLPKNPPTSRLSKFPSAPPVPGSIDGDQGTNNQCDQMESLLGTLPNVDDDSQPLTNTNVVGRDNQRYLDWYMKLDPAFSDKLASTQNEHVRLFVLKSVASIVKILATNRTGQVDSNDLRSKIDSYLRPIGGFGLELSRLKELVDGSLRKLSKFEQTEKLVDDDCKTVETIEKEVEVEHKKPESGKRHPAECTKQDGEKKGRIVEEGNNLVARMRALPCPSDDEV